MAVVAYFNPWRCCSFGVWNVYCEPQVGFTFSLSIGGGNMPPEYSMTKFPSSSGYCAVCCLTNLFAPYTIIEPPPFCVAT